MVKTYILCSSAELGYLLGKSTPRIALQQQSRSLTHLLTPLSSHYSSNGRGNKQQPKRNSSLFCAQRIAGVQH